MSKNFTADLVKLPNGNFELLDKLEKVYLIAQDYAKKESVNFAIFGKPSAPVYQPIVDAELDYWESLDRSKSVQYGELEGEEEYRGRMAKALNRLYQLDNDCSFNEKHIHFTSGGRIAIQAISYLLRKSFSGKKVVTTSFYYPDHTGKSYANDLNHELIYADISSDFKGLTAAALNEALGVTAIEDVGAFIFSDPNNPTGTIVGKEEWVRIIEVFKRYPNVPIIIDEAYAEMVFDAPHESLISVAPPEIMENIILLRSATKGFSVSGERMAILASKNRKFMNKIMEYHAANLVHCPRSIQHAYTYAMEQFNAQEQIKLAAYYQPMVRRIELCLQQNNLNIQHENYTNRPATFYVMADFSHLIGKPMHKSAKDYYIREKKAIENNVDLAMHLLFEYKLAFMPMYFFGATADSGILRITCSFENNELEEVCSKLSRIGAEIEVFAEA